MILLIDNYDSFSYNLFQLVGTINEDIKVIRNDEMSVDEIRNLAPSHIILSPGPKRPKDAGVCIDVVKELGSEMKILGVFSEEYVEKIAKALVKIGVTDAMVVYGTDCLDEISASAETRVAEVRGENITYYTVKPEDFGFERVNKADLVGGTPEENAKIITAVLQGKGTKAQNTAVALNAGAAIYAGELGITLKDAVKKAENIISSGEGYKILEGFVKVTNE